MAGASEACVIMTHAATAFGRKFLIAAAHEKQYCTPISSCSRQHAVKVCHLLMYTGVRSAAGAVRAGCEP